MTRMRGILSKLSDRTNNINQFFIGVQENPAYSIIYFTNSRPLGILQTSGI